MGGIRRAAALKAVWDVVRRIDRPGTPGLATRARALPRMFAQGFGGAYPHLAKGRIMLSVLALLYLVSPVDAVPEILVPLLGLGDDALVAAWLAGALLSEAETFLEWERRQAEVMDGEVVRSRR